jgi:4-carboxymuconolactone decarboxylase
MNGKYDQGLEVRRSVLGAEFVDHAINNATDFNRPMQELVTEYCWRNMD